MRQRRRKLSGALDEFLLARRRRLALVLTTIHGVARRIITLD